MIQPLSKLSETRRKHILGHVEAHLDDGEAIVQWGRVRHPERNSQGFLFLTSARCIIRWRDEDEVRSYPWAEIIAWGVNKDARRGPILSIETAQDEESAQLQIGSKALALGAGRVVRAFARLAPKEASNVKVADHRRIDPEAELVVEKEKLTPQGLARRILIGVVGVAFLVVALAIIPLPGPWSFLLVIAAFALLAREFDWAEDTLDWIKDKYEKAKQRVRSSRST
ncbi:MAG TPA: PGPGW domain-containing protein [Actinomycetota bacterium]|nr:PGPGW domain-containing protein [Actinomycetota bacterium]